MNRKVVIVGSGMVGTSYAYSLINQNLVNEIVLIDRNVELAVAHAQDLNDGTLLIDESIKIYAGDYADCKDADIVCITAGAKQQVGETRIDLLKKNKIIIKEITENIMKSGFNNIILVASNPVDIISYIVKEVSKLPQEKVIGSGTLLDTARFRKYLKSDLKYNPNNGDYILGEHGDSSILVSSKELENEKKNMNADDLEKINDSFEKAKNEAYEIIKGKGATYYGVGICLAYISKAILFNKPMIMPISTYLTGEYGINDMYLGVPALVDKNGVNEVQEIKLSPESLKNLQESARNLKEIYSVI